VALRSWRSGHTTYKDPLTNLSRRELPELHPDRFVRVFSSRVVLDGASDHLQRVQDARREEDWAARRAQEEFVACTRRVQPSAKPARVQRRGRSSFSDLLARRSARVCTVLGDK
jgi:hypothetical protein